MEPLERRQRLVYTSSPDRGLDVLLELWGEIREAVPEATFAWTYAPVYFAVAEQDPTVGAHAAHVRALSKQPGVQPLGALSQPKLAVLMASSMVWAHPSWATPHNAPFFETSCIGAVEAQAGGAVVVASDWGALPETVQVGRLVPGPGGTREWRDALVREIVLGLTDPDVQAHAQTEGPKHAAGLGWAGVALQVEQLIRA
jgi:glycosyltransferase involved in cell wall biosynthesis